MTIVGTFWQPWEKILSVQKWDLKRIIFRLYNFILSYLISLYYITHFYFITHFTLILFFAFFILSCFLILSYLLTLSYPILSYHAFSILSYVFILSHMFFITKIYWLRNFAHLRIWTLNLALPGPAHDPSWAQPLHHYVQTYIIAINYLWVAYNFTAASN